MKNVTTVRHLLAAAALAAAAFGSASPASADPTCTATSAVKGWQLEVCGPGFVCGDSPCQWFNPDVSCTHSNGPSAPACEAIDKL